MRKFIKKLFKSERVIVYKYGKAYKFKSFEKAMLFMIMG